MMSAATLGGSHSPGTEGCCGASASPSIPATFHAGAVLTSTLLVACAWLLHCETGPAFGMPRDLLKTPAFTCLLEQG